MESETPHFLKVRTLEFLAKVAGVHFLNEIAVHFPLESPQTTSWRRQWRLERMDGDIGPFECDFEDIDGDDKCEFMVSGYDLLEIGVRHHGVIPTRYPR